MSGLTGGLENLLGIDTTAGNSQLQQALQAIQGVQTPTAGQLDLPTLQKYVQAGLLTAAQAQAIIANPSTYSDVIQQTQDNSGKAAQSSALQQMQDLYKNGGSNAINQAQLLNNLNQVKQQMNSQNQAVTQNAQNRGVAGGGLEFISQLLNNQSGAQNANSNAVNAASNNAQLALQALGNAGTLGGTMQSQAQQSAQAQAQAAQQIAEYNSQLGTQTNLANTAATNNANQYNLTNAQNVGNQNTGLANYQTQYNAQIPETLYQNQLGKANALSNVYGQQANLAEQQAAQQSAFTGNLIGAGATMGGSYLAGQAMGNGLKALSAGNNSGIQAGNDQSMYPGYTENANNIAAENGFLTEYKGGEIPKMANGGVMRYQPPQQGPNSVGGSGKINLTDILALLSATGLGGLWLNQKFGPGSNPTDLNKEVGNTLGNAALSQSDPNPNPQMLADGGFCYFNGGKVSHDHAICMKAGGHVPGTPKVGGAVNTFANDTVKGLLAPGEIVLPRSVTQAPNAPVKAAQFVNQVKNPAPASGSFQDVLSHLANHGMEMHIRPSKMTTRI